ncbi:NAD-dependent epimerase/dehydratase family protein [Candidatus Jorgensenbacteria bacterium]|nr:NAD-dependent epimerase/dehydratase family protein [Candidatus Jorgensenbacteria bacterium]
MKSSQKIIYNDIKNVCDAIDVTPFRGKRVLIAGANGLIGAYFGYLLNYLNENHSFNVQVDLITRNEITEKARIYALKEAKNFNVIQQDLGKYFSYTKNYDYIVHAAGYGAPSRFLENPFNVMDVNYIGLKCMLESYLVVNPKVKILYLSSSEIYGSPPPDYFPTPETYPGNSSVTNNRACYIESKRLAEVLALNYIAVHGMDIKIARPALSYGPGLMFDDQRVIGQFMRKAHYNKAIDMIDDGRDLRCFCYISDAIQELINILLFGKESIYNVGSSEEEVSIKDLAMMIGEIMGAKVIVGPGKTSEVIGAPSRVCLDLKKIKNEFGFKPAVPLKEGLRRMIEWNLALEEERKTLHKKDGEVL